MTESKKVVIAMSGGVDSSVAACLLKDQGFEVTGIMLKLWADECGEKENSCCPPEAIQQAREVASLIQIPFYVLDIQELFKKKIVDFFVDQYVKGLTPNPCFNCNRWIRWGYLLDFCLETGNQYLATGHYARITQMEDQQYVLQRGIDPSKDQSYVLAGLTSEQLGKTILPLGKYKKAEVREIARIKGLPVAEKHDSQDLCFINKNGYRNFLQRYASAALVPGPIRDTTGKIVGEHSGLANYTIGQRKGLGAGFSEPMYVVRKEMETNSLVIGPESSLGQSVFYVKDYLLREISNPSHLTVKIRYKSAFLDCLSIERISDLLRVELSIPARDITAGQIAVFYDGETIVGSGVITSFSEGERS